MIIIFNRFKRKTSFDFSTKLVDKRRKMLDVNEAAQQQNKSNLEASTIKVGGEIKKKL